MRRPLVFARRGDGVSRLKRRVDGVYVGSAMAWAVGSAVGSAANHPWARGSAVGSAVSSDAPAWGWTHLPETPYAIAARGPIRHRRERSHIRHRRNAAPTHRRRSLFQELAKKFSECGSAKKGGDLGMFRRGKMSAAFELAAFNLDVHELSKTVASSSGVHLIYRVA